MTGNYARLTMSLTAAMLLSLPLGAAAQTPAPQPPPAQSPVMQPPATQPPATQPPPSVPPMTQMPPTTPPTSSAAVQTPATPEANGAVVLLDRISEIIDQSLGGDESTAKKSDKGTPGAKGTTGVVKMGKTSAGQVSVERASLDEIKAEVEQLRIMLQDRKP